MATDCNRTAIGAVWGTGPADLFKVRDGLLLGGERLENLNDVHGYIPFDATYLPVTDSLVKSKSVLIRFFLLETERIKVVGLN